MSPPGRRCNHLLIAGCGRLGGALAELLQGRGDGPAVTVLARTPRTLSGARSIQADLLAARDLYRLAGDPADAVVFCPAPDRHDAGAYRDLYLHGLQNLLACGTLARGGRLIFVSSTAVYGQDDGSLVDEQSTTRPQRDNGRILLEAERHALSWPPGGRSGNRCCVRLGGLYTGLPKRYLELLGTDQPAPEKLYRWTNRIHAVDAARLLQLLLTMDEMPPIINGVDNEPATLLTILQWLQARHPASVAMTKLLQQPPPHPVSGKRVSNSRALDIGFRPACPSFRAGFASDSQPLNIRHSA